MKWNKALLSGFMMASLVSAPLISAPIFAAEETGTITIEFSEKDDQVDSFFAVYRVASIEDNAYVSTEPYKDLTLDWTKIEGAGTAENRAMMVSYLEKRIDDEKVVPFHQMEQPTKGDPMVFKDLPQGIYLVRQLKAGDNAGKVLSFLVSINPGHMDITSRSKADMPNSPGTTDNPNTPNNPSNTDTPGMPQGSNPGGNTPTGDTTNNYYYETTYNTTTNESRVPTSTNTSNYPQNSTTPSSSRTPSSTDDLGLPKSSIPNTGMNLWKVPYLALAGLLSMTCGWLMIGKKKKA